VVRYPYIHTIDGSYINLPFEYDNTNGVQNKKIEGFHGVWAARIPFLPAMLSEDFKHIGVQRISLIQQRQFRFIYDLARIRENNSTFMLRFISTPNPLAGQPNLIDIIFLGKIFSKNKSSVQPFGELLWERFSSIFPTEEPFNYPLETIINKNEFLEYYEPIKFSTIEPEHILEIRKFEEMPISSTAKLGRVERKGDYISHPFVPDQNFNPLGSFFQTLTTQPAKCSADVSLRPTKLFDQEIFNVSFMIGQFKKTASEDDDVTEEYIRKRSQIGVYVYENLMLEREQLMMVRVQLVGEDYSPKGLANALGSEMMGNAANKYPTMWNQVQPTNSDQMETVMHNLMKLEHDIWGNTIASAPLTRLRYFVTAQEAYGAFRLPVPSESGYMPGVLIRNEPFITPVDELELREQTRIESSDDGLLSTKPEKSKKINIGKVYHRGSPTAQYFSIAIKDLSRHTLIAGSTGSGKTTTIKHILSQLWIDHHVPFMVLYPVDKPDYRDLAIFEELYNDMLIYTLSDETTSPFRFNPFEIPEGILLKSHISRLMRVFESSFSLSDPLPMIYREALRKVYRDKGWDIILDRGSYSKEYPIMSEFYATIKDITEELNYGREVQDNVRQASVIRIGDLLENAGHVVNVRSSMNFSKILSYPTIMELGRVGSTEDIALIMGFLLTRLQEEIENNPRPSEKPHITVVEEAHRLMAEGGTEKEFSGNTRRSSGEDFSNMLAEVRGYGEGIIIAEQIPTTLVKGAIGNTYLKIMHWIEDPASFQLFSEVMNLNMQQKEYSRTLKTGFALVRSPYGAPVHLKVPDPISDSDYKKIKNLDISDAQLRVQMIEKQKKIDLVSNEIIKWGNTTSTLNVGVKKDLRDTDWFMDLPMQTCVNCPWLARNKKNTGLNCHQTQVKKHVLGENVFAKQVNDHFYSIVNKTENDHSDYFTKLNVMIQTRFVHLSDQDSSEWAYCATAHLMDAFLHSPGISLEKQTKVKSILRG